AVRAREEVADVAIRAVLEMPGQPLDTTLHGHRLVDRACAEAAARPSEEPQLPVRIEAAVTHPAAPEDVAPRDGVAVGRTVRGEDASDVGGQLRRDDLVGVERQDPVPRREVDRGVLLERVTGPRPDDDVIGELARDGRRLVLGLRVDDDDLVGPGDRLQAGAQALFFVARDDGDRKARSPHRASTSSTASSTGGTSIDAILPSGAATT